MLKYSTIEPFLKIFINPYVFLENVQRVVFFLAENKNLSSTTLSDYPSMMIQQVLSKHCKETNSVLVSSAPSAQLQLPCSKAFAISSCNHGNTSFLKTAHSALIYSTFVKRFKNKYSYILTQWYK